MSATTPTYVSRRGKAVYAENICGETPCAQRKMIRISKEKILIPDRPVIAPTK